MRVAASLALLLALASTAAAEPITAPTVCAADVACLNERVRDLRDYREFLEDQLALCKAVTHTLDAQLAKKLDEIKALQAPPKDRP